MVLGWLWSALFGRTNTDPKDPLEPVDWSEFDQDTERRDRRPVHAPPRPLHEDDEWLDWRPKERPGDSDWAIVRVVHVKGTGLRWAQARAFINAFKNADRLDVPYAVEVTREPENPADQNALAVFGLLGSERRHLGYVPRDVAAAIAAQYPAGMPLSARFQRISTVIGDEGKFAIFIAVLRPAKRSEWWRENMKE